MTVWKWKAILISLGRVKSSKDYSKGGIVGYVDILFVDNERVEQPVSSNQANFEGMYSPTLFSSLISILSILR